MSMKSLEMAFYYLRYGQFDSNLMLVQPVSVKWSSNRFGNDSKV